MINTIQSILKDAKQQLIGHHSMVKLNRNSDDEKACNAAENSNANFDPTHSSWIFGKAQTTESRECTQKYMTDDERVCNTAENSNAKSMDSYALDAEILLAHVLQVSRSYLLAHSEQVLDDAQTEQYKKLLMRRYQHEPIAYMRGYKEFWSLNVSVTTDTLIPRSETELLVESILNLYPDQTLKKIADLGTGSGAIALALAHEKRNWQIVATDKSEKALCIAKKNAQILELNNIAFYHGDWCNALPSRDFDIIVSNPPYVSEAEWENVKEHLQHEPCTAFLSGTDGLDAIRVIAQSASSYLKLGGRLLMEHGYSQAQTVRQILTECGYSQIYSVYDLSGCERVTIASIDEENEKHLR